MRFSKVLVFGVLTLLAMGAVISLATASALTCTETGSGGLTCTDGAFDLQIDVMSGDAGNGAPSGSGGSGGPTGNGGRGGRGGSSGNSLAGSGDGGDGGAAKGGEGGGGAQ